jgi:hypothetical protein
LLVCLSVCACGGGGGWQDLYVANVGDSRCAAAVRRLPPPCSAAVCRRRDVSAFPDADQSKGEPRVPPPCGGAAVLRRRVVPPSCAAVYCFMTNQADSHACLSAAWRVYSAANVVPRRVPRRVPRSVGGVACVFWDGVCCSPHSEIEGSTLSLYGVCRSPHELTPYAAVNPSIPKHMPRC